MTVRRRVAAIGVALVAVAAAGAVVVVTRDAGGPPRPAGPVPPWARPMVEATTLPPGWFAVTRSSVSGEPVSLGPGRTGWAERVTYRRQPKPYQFPFGEVTFTTTSGYDPAEVVEPADVHRSDPAPHWVTLGPRRVVRFVVKLPDTAHRYLWTEAPGVEVLAEPVGDTTEEEIQALVAGARMAAPRPSPALGKPVAEPGARVLLPEVSGRGSTVLGPIRVRRRALFSVYVACDGKPLRLDVNGRRSTDQCDRPDIVALHVREVWQKGGDEATIRITASEDTTWRVLVTTFVEPSRMP